MAIAFLVLLTLLCPAYGHPLTPDERQVEVYQIPKDAKVTSGCGGILIEQSGVFSSPGYPDGYETNLDCRWLIRLGPNQRILLTVHNSTTEDFYDRITVYDGGDTAAAILTELSGPTYTASVVTSTTNVILVQFTTDSINSYPGFLASYRPDTFGRVECGDVLITSAGLIQSPYFENSFYPNAIDCQWIVKVDGATSIQIDFNDFNTQAGRDILTIEDPFSASPVLLTHSGTVVPTSITTSSNQLIVRFKTDASINYYRGFQLQYSATLPEKKQRQ